MSACSAPGISRRPSIDSTRVPELSKAYSSAITCRVSSRLAARPLKAVDLTLRSANGEHERRQRDPFLLGRQPRRLGPLRPAPRDVGHPTERVADELRA